MAERDGVVVDSNFLDERGPIRGVGPISVDPACKAPVSAAVSCRRHRARSRRVRLVQDSFNMTSLSLYTSLGFETREPLVLLRGVPRGALPAGLRARQAHEPDVAPISSRAAASIRR